MIFTRDQVAETRCKKVCTSKSDLRTNDFSIVGSLPRDFELSNFDCYGKPIETAAGKSQSKNNKRPPPPKPVIPSAAKRVDLYARALFPFSFLFFNVIYWSIYLWLRRDESVERSPPLSPTLAPIFTPAPYWSDYTTKFYNSKWNLRDVSAEQDYYWKKKKITLSKLKLFLLSQKKSTYCV